MRRCSPFALAAFAAVVLSSGAHASGKGAAVEEAGSVGDIPRFDVERYCTDLASFGGEYSAMMFNGCVTNEQQSYDGLRAKWRDLPPEVQAYCIELANFGGAPSYMMLGGCVQNEMQAREGRATFSFD